MPQASSSVATAQTDTILVAAPGVGYKTQVEALFVSSLGAQTVTLSSDGIVAVKEVTTVDRGTSTGGTFTLTYDTETTGALNWNDSAATVETAVELLANVTTATVTGTGAVGTPWVITIDTPVKNFAVSGTGSLTGGDSTLTVTETTDGLAAGAARRIVYLPATSTHSESSDRIVYECGENAALCYTSSAATSVFVAVEYVTVPV